MLYFVNFNNNLENDRKTNIEMWEETKKRNVEEMKRLKEENRDFRQKVATLQRVCGCYS